MNEAYINSVYKAHGIYKFKELQRTEFCESMKYQISILPVLKMLSGNELPPNDISLP